tara:strand:+ start:3279 stop:3953 length:675 start_codon:yes stop_codon:yes gene_type:complete
MAGTPTAGQTEPTRLPARGVAYLALLTLTWGANWPFISMAVEDMPVLVFRAGCALTVGVVVLGLAGLSGTSLRIPKQNWRFLALAAFFNVSLWFYLSATAVSLAPSGHIGALAHTIPLWVFLIDTIVFGQQPSAAKWLGLMLGLSAVIVLGMRNFQATDSSLWGVAAILAGAMSWAIGANVVKRINFGAPVITVLGWQALIGSVPLLIAALPQFQEIGPIGTRA